MPRADARERRSRRRGATIAEALGWRHDVIFTSGASEAVADRRGAGDASSGRIVSPTEHDVVDRRDG